MAQEAQGINLRHVVKVTVQQVEDGRVPVFANPSDACADCCTRGSYIIPVGYTTTIPLGFKMQLPEGWEGLIRGRSGLAQKGLSVHPGTIDHLYRKEVGCIVTNNGRDTMVLEFGEKVCQLAVRRVDKVVFEAGEVEETGRGGFGSTGRWVKQVDYEGRKEGGV